MPSEEGSQWGMEEVAAAREAQRRRLGRLSNVPIGEARAVQGGCPAVALPQPEPEPDPEPEPEPERRGRGQRQEEAPRPELAEAARLRRAGGDAHPVIEAFWAPPPQDQSPERLESFFATVKDRDLEQSRLWQQSGVC